MINVKFRQIYIQLIGLILTAWLCSCSEARPLLDLPTLIPTEHLPTAIALTSQALISQAESATPVEQIEQPETTLTPTMTETPAIANTPTLTSTPVGDELSVTPLPPLEIPYADIQFINPGALSKVISPIELHVYLLPDDAGRARVELFSEDGGLMYRKLFVFGSSPGVQTHLRAEIDYEINGVAETASLVVSVDDAYGRIKTLATQELILLSLGDSDINPPGDFLEPILIEEPAPKILVQGGALVVSGLARTASDQPLLVELITTDGRVIGNRLAGISPEPEGGHRLFATNISYNVTSPTWVRVTVSERNYQLGGPYHLASVEVLLAP